MSEMLQAGAALSHAALAALPEERLDALAATIELAPLGIAHFDREGRFLLVNRRLCEMLDRSRRDLLQLNFLELTHHEDLAECVELTARLAAGEIPSYRHEKRFVRADGSTFWAAVTVSVARQADGHPDFFIGMAEDVTERRRSDETRQSAEQELKRALGTAEHATRLRDEMVAVVAHDLRNPLHTIALAAGTLESPNLATERRQRLQEIIRQTAINMGELLDNLLDVSRLESGTFAISHEAVSPGFLAEAMERHFAPRAAQKDIAWSVHLERELPHIEGDPHRLEQLLSNLVGNALKFTPPGGRLCLKCRSHAEGVEFVVEDSGPGIAPEHLERLFDRFWKADPASHNGAGLGLAIARGIVEAHGGRIWAESVQGKGAAFRVVLPTLAHARR